MRDRESTSPGQASSNQTNVREVTLCCKALQAERKKITCSLHQNRNGRYLRICEEAGIHVNNVVIPAAGVPEMLKIISDVMSGESASAAAPEP